MMEEETKNGADSTTVEEEADSFSANSNQDNEAINDNDDNEDITEENQNINEDDENTNEYDEDVDDNNEHMKEDVDEDNEDIAEESEDVNEDNENSKGPRAPKRSAGVIVIDDSDSDDSSVCHVESYQATASEAKKLRKGYSSSEPSSSSSSESEDEDDTSNVIPTEPSELSLKDVISKKESTSIDIKLNEHFKAEEIDKKFLSCWSEKQSFTSDNITLLSQPFQICVLDNFLNNADAINNIVDDMNTLDWFRKTMDLYEFYRTADLKELTWQRNIKAVYDLLTNDVMKWVASITDTNLTHISASCALYGPGDYLLTHDDLLDDRKIAFILYLAPWSISNESKGEQSEKNQVSSANELNFINNEKENKGWLKTMGGELQFFSSNSEGQPTTVAKSLLPRNNTFAFFKVNNISFHQVAEVVSYDYPRLTINGWFHGPVENDPKTDEEKSSVSVTNCHKPNEDVLKSDLMQWISPTYLSPKCKSQIFEKFEETSEISLESYFLEPKYKTILDILQSNELEWEQCGPVNLKHYKTLSLKNLTGNNTGLLKDMIEVFTSKYFIDLLKDYTGQSILSYSKLEIQKWNAGCYTVIPVKEEYSMSEVDVALYLGSPERQLKGGIITYLTPEEAESDPIISVGQKNNALNIVYSESGIAKFSKYISKLSLKEHEHYYAFVCSYRNTEPN